MLVKLLSKCRGPTAGHQPCIPETWPDQVSAKVSKAPISWIVRVFSIQPGPIGLDQMRQMMMKRGQAKKGQTSSHCNADICICG
eukprot:1136984-Pelagomonas_calceolata.AAC.2